MNAPVPHLGQTLSQKQALGRYREIDKGAVLRRLHDQTDQLRREQADDQRVGHELLERFRLHDTGGCAEVDHQPSLLFRFVASLRRSFGRWWPVAVTVWAAYVGVGVLATVVCVRAWA